MFIYDQKVLICRTHNRYPAVDQSQLTKMKQARMNKIVNLLYRPYYQVIFRRGIQSSRIKNYQLHHVGVFLEDEMASEAAWNFYIRTIRVTELAFPKPSPGISEARSDLKIT